MRIAFWILAFIGYSLAGRIGIQAHEDPTEMDTVSYLEEALRIRQTGGIAAFIPNCFNGVYRQATQHPAYLLLLSPFAEPTLDFFIKAKWVTYWIGLVFLGVLFWAARRRFGEVAADVAVMLALLSASFIHMTTMVACESLLAVFFVAWWVFAGRGFEDRKYFLWAGVCAAGVFLTKSIGILLLPIFYLTYLLRQVRSPRRLLDAYAWGYGACFFLVSSPLLIRNWIVYGTPFYSNSSYVLWIDRWHDYLRPDLAANPPTLSGYLNTHSWAQVIKVFWEGLWIRDVKMMADVLKPFAFWRSPVALDHLRGFYERTASFQEMWAVLLIGLAAAGLFWRAGREQRLLTLITAAIFLIFVGWFSKVFPGAPPARLVYLVWCLVILYAARALSMLAPARWIRIGLLLIAAYYSVSLALHHDWNGYRRSSGYAIPPAARAQIDWAIRHAKPNERILGNAAFVNNAFYFKNAIPAGLQSWPTFRNMDEAVAYLRSEEIRYAFVDLSTVAYNREVFGRYYTVGRTIGMVRTRDLPEPFREIPLDPKFKHLFELYIVD